MKGKKKKREEIRVFGIRLVLTSAQKRLLSYSAHHHAKIQSQSKICNVKYKIFKSTELNKKL